MTRLENLRIRLETVWIRTRAWLSTGVQMAALGAFLLGLLAIRTVLSSRAFELYGDRPGVSAMDILALEEPIVFLGREVPGLLGLTPMQTLFVIGLSMTIGGLAISLRLVTGRATPAPGY